MKILDVPHTNITEMKQSPGSAFDKAKESNSDVYVFKNNKPYGVVMTTDQYEAMYNKTEMLQDRLEEYVIRERNDVGPAAFPRHGTKPMSGQRCFPDMARNRCRARGVSPTWHETDVGPAVFPRRGIKTMSGQRCFPDMARNRCRGRGVSPTWHKTDVGPAVFPRRGIKPMSGQRCFPDVA